MTKRLLTLSSFLGVIYFYLIVTPFDIPGVQLPQLLHDNWLGYATKIGILTILAIMFSYLTLRTALVVFKAGNTLEVDSVKPLENTAMPTYIGLFVITLGLKDFKLEQSILILLVLIVFWGYFERVFYFNPIWLFFGYRFYEVSTSQGNTFTLITTKQNLKHAQKFENLRRVNEYTFLEV